MLSSSRVWPPGAWAGGAAEAAATVDAVGCPLPGDDGVDPQAAAERKPHEFSGGQCQRISIARAVVTDPELIICDEPVSALDVSIRAQVLDLLAELQARYGLGYLFISHDIGVVRYLADRIAVMYVGRIVELGTTDQIFEGPNHPYTEALLAAVPSVDPGFKQERKRLRIPTGRIHRHGCPLVDRCPVRQDRCETEKPLLELLGGGHRAACHLAEERMT